MTPSYTNSSGEKEGISLCDFYTKKRSIVKKYIQVYLGRVKRNKLLGLFFHWHGQLQLEL